jgi:hypothetical protein
MTQSAAYNEHIAKIAALPSFERNYYFRGELLVGKCVEAAASAICRTLGVSRLGCSHFGYFL